MPAPADSCPPCLLQRLLGGGLGLALVEHGCYFLELAASQNGKRFGVRRVWSIFVVGYRTCPRLARAAQVMMATKSSPKGV